MRTKSGQLFILKKKKKLNKLETKYILTGSKLFIRDISQNPSLSQILKYHRFRECEKETSKYDLNIFRVVGESFKITS